MNCKEAFDLIDNEIAALNDALRTGDDQPLTGFLDLMARFFMGSFWNAALIQSQRPDATHVAGFNAWKKQGRSVRKGERGTAILSPAFGNRSSVDVNLRDPDNSRQSVISRQTMKMNIVFDISQTEGDPVPACLPTDADFGIWMEIIEQLVGKDESLDEKTQSSFTESRELRQNEYERFAAMVQIWAPKRLHHHSGLRKGLTQTVCEAEAKAFAYVVCHACGIPLASEDREFVPLYRGSQESLSESLAYIKQSTREWLGILNIIKGVSHRSRSVIVTA